MATGGDLHNWNRLKTGDSKAFDALFAEYVSYLYNYGHTLTSKEELIKDAIQDVFLELWNKRNKIHIKSSLKFHILQAFRRKLIYLLKEDKIIPLELHNLPEAAEGSIQMEMIERENRKIKQFELDSMAKLLSPRQREAIFLKFYRGMDSMEIAELMKIDVKAVYKLISTGIIRYRRNFKKN